VAVNHRIGRLVFALLVGATVAFLSYRWITDPAPRLERQLQEVAVRAARSHLHEVVGTNLEIVDPLATDRKVGKAYVYRAGDGWQVSGYYRRGADDEWHPFLMSLAADTSLSHLKVEDSAVHANDNPSVDVTP
jgi:hypothetical protein